MSRDLEYLVSARALPEGIALHSIANAANVARKTRIRLIEYETIRPRGWLWSRPRASDARLANAFVESCALQTETRRRPRRTGDDPIGISQDAQDVFTLDRFQSVCAILANSKLSC